ncbi:MAG: hypothetical protein ACE5JJ_04545 [Nitrospinota bacterium]
MSPQQLAGVLGGEANWERREVQVEGTRPGLALLQGGARWKRARLARRLVMRALLFLALLGLAGGCAALLPPPRPFLGQTHYRAASFPALPRELGHPSTGHGRQHSKACWAGRTSRWSLEGERVEEVRRAGWRRLWGHLAFVAEVFFSLPEVERVRLTYRGVLLEEMDRPAILARDACYRFLVEGYPVPVARARARELEVEALDGKGVSQMPAYKPEDTPFAELLRRWGTPRPVRGGRAWRWSGDLTVGVHYAIPSIRVLAERSLTLSPGKNPEAALPQFGHRIRVLALGGETTQAIARIQLFPLDGRFPTSSAPITLGRFDDLALLSGDGSELVRLRPARVSGGFLMLELARGRIELKPGGRMELAPAMW